MERGFLLSNAVETTKDFRKSNSFLLHLGKACYITGWGNLYGGGPTPRRLQQAYLPSVDSNTCDKGNFIESSVTQEIYIFKKSSFRSSHPEVFLRKGVLKICSKFTGENPCRSSISIKLLLFLEHLLVAASIVYPIQKLALAV